MKKVLLFLMCSINVFAQTLQTMKRLPDTGQTASYTSTFGEDNDYNFFTPYFIKNNNGIITDTITSLQWQQTDGGELKIENAMMYCDTLTLGGYTDWRLPNAQEAFSILNMQNVNPAINTTYFTNTGAEYWWTSVRQANDTNKIWCTNAGGGIGNHPRTETISAGGNKKFHVRAVRDAVPPPIIPNHYTDNSNGTITDNLTNLVWQKIPSTTAQTWEQAIAMAENLSLAGFTDWHLPNIKELQSLNDEGVIAPSISSPYFQNLGVKKYWSSTTLPNQTTKVWYWDTQFGITTYDTKTNTNYVICVRNNSTATSLQASTTLPIMSVYPNPFTNKIIIANSTKNQQLQLSNVYGEIVYQGTQIELQDFSNLPAGIYILQNINANSFYKIEKQ